MCEYRGVLGCRCDGVENVRGAVDRHHMLLIGKVAGGALNRLPGKSTRGYFVRALPHIAIRPNVEIYV